jgi:hypothetical protein
MNHEYLSSADVWTGHFRYTNRQFCTAGSLLLSVCVAVKAIETPWRLLLQRCRSQGVQLYQTGNVRSYAVKILITSNLI